VDKRTTDGENSDVTEIQGRVADGFEPVLDAFTSTMDGVAPEGVRGGAATSLVVDGELVVDLWAGTADAAPTADPVGREWGADTRAVVFSSTKGVIALCVLHLCQAGLLDLDAPVARYWPEFAQQGKDSVTVRQTLGHRAGVPVVDGISKREQVLSWEAMVTALADQIPLWEPGTAYQYHALTYGWLGGELIRRVSGQLPGAYLQEVFAGPLALRTAIGVPVADQGDIATIIPAAPADPANPDDDPASIPARAISINSSLIFPGGRPRHDWNDADVLAAQIPGANGVSSARDLAALYAAVVGTAAPGGLLGDAVITDAMTVQSQGPNFDGSSVEPTARWGAGLEVSSPVRPMFGPGSFGHAGAGGQLAFGDIDHRAGFAYVTNRMGGDEDSRANDVVAAARKLLD
jgi:CubicO group peptidase (beta-lactamase class C family)